MTTEQRNRLALFMLVLGKIAGVVGIVISNRTFGGALLLLDGVMIVGAVGICIMHGRQLAAAERTPRDVLAQMVREGTVDLFLREVRTSMRQSRETPSTRLLPGG